MLIGHHKVCVLLFRRLSAAGGLARLQLQMVTGKMRTHVGLVTIANAIAVNDSVGTRLWSSLALPGSVSLL